MDVIEKRRSNYDLGNNLEISKKDLINLLRKIIYYAPSPFNVQSSKIVLLNKKSHHLLWTTVVEEFLKKNNNGDLLDSDKARIKREDKAYGTILFYKDERVIEEFKEKLDAYEQKSLDSWCIEESAMLQMNIWNELRLRNIGAHIVHFDDIDEEVSVAFDIDKNYKLVAMMVFGNIIQEAAVKPKKDIDKRFIDID
ncbi:MAG: nitroreductase family protein [Clostridiales bacterium]|jgi:oxidoreductase related to nitroreductase-like protein|nr:nitroreductase family protein [Clostridiales bacterium]